MKNKRTDQVLAALMGPLPETPARSEPSRGNGPKPGHIRFTFDIDPEQHYFIRHFVLESRTSASAAMRELWSMVEEDSALAERLRGALASRHRDGL
jgi:hypothetical protein